MKVNYKFKINHVIYLAIFITVVSMIISLGINNTKKTHKQMSLDWRAQKDNYFRTDDNSPIRDRESFTGLNYFDPDMKYKIAAHLTLLKDTNTVIMLRTDGSSDRYLRHAIATFTLDEKEYQLTMFRPVRDSVNKNVLFVPFTDNTNGELSYKAGRYLDIVPAKPNEAIIDFNYAYNPFCAYNPRFSCPIPPKENYLDTEILAGEKIYELPE